MGGLIAFVAVMVAVLMSLSWVLGPLDLAAKNRRYPMQFGLADLLCLGVLIQVLVASLHWPSQGEANRPIIALDVLFGAVVTFLWWLAVRTLSRAGIHTVWQRCVILMLVMPVSYIGCVAIIVLPFVAASHLLDRQLATAAWLLLAEVILIGVLYAFSRLTRAIAAASKEKDVAIEAIVLPEDENEMTVSEEP
jgi:hypothetical protein